jgi:small subunit ribosomal protein S1
MTTNNSEQNGAQVNETMMDAATFAEMLDDYDYQLPKRGQIIQGKILRVEEDAVFMDVGAKRDAIVPHTDLDRLTEDLIQSLEKGNEIPVYVLKTPTGDEELLVSINKGLEQKDWDRAEVLLEEDETVELDVVGYNKGGLLVQFGQLQGFVPNSHVPSLRYGGNQSQIESRKAKKVDDRLLLKVLEVNQQRRRLIFSAKAAQKEQRRRLLENLEVGSIVEGRVANIVKYGAFVDLGGGVSGLLHVSELAWHRVDHPSEELSVGEELEVQIQDVDVDRERVSLSRKAVLPNPWDTIEERYNIGDLIAGRVTNVEDFGAFVEVQSGVVGLVHVSEIEIYGPATIKDIVRPGDEVLVRIIDIDPYEERLSLSLRRVTSEEQIEWMRRHEQEEEGEGAEAATESETDETEVAEATSGADEVSADASAEEPEAITEADSLSEMTQAIADELDSVVDEVIEDEPVAADSETDDSIETKSDEVEPVA